MSDKKKKKISDKEPTSKASGAAYKPAADAGPLVGIIGWNSPRFSESHGAYVEALKSAIVAHGGRVVFFGISGSCDSRQLFGGYTNGHSAPGMENGNGLAAATPANYWLPSRDIVADQIEMIAQEEHLDGLAMIPWSVNSLVGMLMASARCCIPTIFAPNYTVWPEHSRSAGAAPDSERKEISLSYGQCSMMLLLEVFGLAKLGTVDQIFRKEKTAPAKGALPPIPGAENIEGARWAGQRIAEMSRQKISLKRFFSPATFHNAATVDMALGSSAESVLHLSAVAYEAGVPLPLTFFNDLAKKVPQLVAMGRNGELMLEDFEKMGGIQQLLGGMIQILQPSPTVMGKNLVELAKENHGRSSFKLDRPFRKEAALAVLFGNLAKEGALFRASGLKDASLSGSGPCRVFNAENTCMEAILEKKIKKGDVIVLRYCGPRGSPGMPWLSGVKEALEKKGLEESVMILTDGRVNISGKTPSIVHVAPEAAVGSTLSVLQDNDVVTWDFNLRSLTVRLTETEIKVRLSRWKEQEKNMRNSFLYRYSKYSSSSSYGAKLV